MEPLLASHDTTYNRKFLIAMFFILFLGGKAGAIYYRARIKFVILKSLINKHRFLIYDLLIYMQNWVIICVASSLKFINSSCGIGNETNGVTAFGIKKR